MKKISVIVNCYNGEEYLENCLNSILNQNFKNFEIIFFDNASTDNTNNIIKNFNDNRIKYFLSEKNYLFIMQGIKRFKNPQEN